jgi:hypothetical protein
MHSVFEQLSAHLRTQTPDTQDWADGGGHEVASELLQRFATADWEELSRSWRLNNGDWRTCLAEIIVPQSVPATNLLLDMTSDPDLDVSFAALRSVAFYCGVNANSEGPFVDLSICVPAFLQSAKDHPRLLLNLEHIRSQCSAYWDQMFTLLAARLSHHS